MILGGGVLLAQNSAADGPQRRVDVVRRTKGLVAFWDFALRDPSGRFAAHQQPGDATDLSLEATNYVLDYWGEGRAASYDDFPLVERGPFGRAVRFSAQTDRTFRPVLLVPRDRLHNTRLDVKGPGRSVSMVVWMVRESGNHGVAGIWHEGTDLRFLAGNVRRVESGRRQYGLFTGLAANPGGSAAHVSENGGPSFGDRYARNLSVSPEVTPTVAATATREEIDHGWVALGFVFDNARNRVTSYLDGVASDHWIDSPDRHPFFRWVAKGWSQAHLAAMPGLQEGEDPGFDSRQYYQPPEAKPRKRTVLETSDRKRVELHEFEFTKVRITWGLDERGRLQRVLRRELAALRVNPFWFPHDLHAPDSEGEGGPFTIGGFIHSSRSQGFTGYLGGVAVFDRGLSSSEMQRLAALCRVSAGRPRTTR